MGYPWYAEKYRQTGIHTEYKYLLLQYAFEKLNCIAVEFRTNWHNARSRTAISRLGARQDGIVRDHQINSDGRYRTTVVFSIIAQARAEVKKSLKCKRENTVRKYSEPNVVLHRIKKKL